MVLKYCIALLILPLCFFAIVRKFNPDTVESTFCLIVSFFLLSGILFYWAIHLSALSTLLSLGFSGLTYVIVQPFLMDLRPQFLENLLNKIPTPVEWIWFLSPLSISFLLSRYAPEHNWFLGVSVTAIGIAASFPCHVYFDNKLVAGGFELYGVSPSIQILSYIMLLIPAALVSAFGGGLHKKSVNRITH